jgi:hypothetical protein
MWDRRQVTLRNAHYILLFSVLQFLCLKNIRTFLAACCDTFGMRKSELFEAFDLFDVRDFGKVLIYLLLN